MTAPKEHPAEPDLHSREDPASSRLRMRLSPEALIIVTAHNRILLVDSPSWNMEDFNKREIIEILVPEAFRNTDGEPYAQSSRHHEFPVELIIGHGKEKPSSHASIRDEAPCKSSPNEKLAQGPELVKYCNDPILLLGRDGCVLSWNMAAERLYGFASEEVLGKSFSRFVPHESRATEERQRQKVLEGGFIPSFDTSRVARDGMSRAVCVSISPVRDASGAIVGTLEIGRDESDRRGQEKALTARLASLTQSNKELQDYAAIVAHDLQAPLNLIAAYFGALSGRGEDAMDEKTRDLFDSASAAVPRMKKLIKDLLDMARLDGSKPEPARADCAAVVAQALANLEMAIKESGAIVKVGPMPVVTADPTQLMQVFQNLISNAIKFRGARAPEVKVSADLRPGEWRFSVSDNGIGIDPGLVQKLFQPLQRLQPNPLVPGSGLGLAIARRITTRHGGRIWVESEPGVGSTFYFTLPAADSGASAETG